MDKAPVLDARVMSARLRKAREARGLGLREAARLAGISPTVISHAEGGERIEGMTIATLRRLSEVYGQTEAWLSGVDPGPMVQEKYPARAQAMRVVLNRLHEGKVVRRSGARRPA